MRNQMHIPFERNRYFYGKLMTAEDFETEQNYMNDKRRLLSRQLHGCGVVTGMEVIQTDDLSISLEAGLALDYAGREIVVAEPVLLRLSLLEGFSELLDDTSGRDCLYLCIEYQEEKIREVENIAGESVYKSDSDAGTSVKEYAASQEKWRVFLRPELPSAAVRTPASLRMTEAEVYTGEHFYIRHHLERYARAGGETELIVEICRRTSGMPLAFSYVAELGGLTINGEPEVKISYDERLSGQKERHILHYYLKAADSPGAEGNVRIRPESFWMNVREEGVMQPEILRVKIQQMQEYEALQNEYRSCGLDPVRDKNSTEPIYLAAVHLLKAGPSYVIERISPLPAGQYVPGGVLMQAEIDLMRKEIEILRQEQRRLRLQQSGRQE